ncbi:hypothetical protein DPM19_18945 [Actinomadura craniellae]|uniref:Uncharacterized protein n=1 Tax=Actinomadura craniellae TaxID=2231787 RepID=A0A365H3Q9_9ACTN|nr:hypothetical protein DPM19_18945 [Actinomadura craniellae]
MQPVSLIHDPYDVIFVVWEYLRETGCQPIALSAVRLPEARRATEELMCILGVTPEVPPATD